MVAVPSTAAAAAVPSTVRVAAIPADRDHRDGDHRGTHRWDEAGGGSNSNSSQGGNTSSSNNANNSQSGSNGSSLVELNNVLENSLNGISIHVLGG
jgi:hypothetical protein